MLTLSGKVISASSCWTSLGRSRSTGPGRPVVAMKKASLTANGTSAGDRGWSVYFVTGVAIPTTSVSWNAFLPVIAFATWPVMATRGEESA